MIVLNLPNLKMTKTCPQIDQKIDLKWNLNRQKMDLKWPKNGLIKDFKWK